MSYSKNEFHFYVKNSNNVGTFNFECSGHEIGKSADWGGEPSASYSKGDMLLTIHADRNGSESVALRFKDETKNEAFGCDTLDSLPEKLNFYVRGKIVFTYEGAMYTVENVCIGQGHNFKQRNNWWIGGKNMTKDAKDRITQTISNGTRSLKLIFTEKGVSEMFIEIVG